MFKEMELKRHYNTIEQLQQNEEMKKFIKWLSNKEPEFYDKSAKRKGKKEEVAFIFCKRARAAR